MVRSLSEEHHISLQWLYRCEKFFAQIARLLEMLAELNFTLEHRPGNQHGNTEGLSQQEYTIHCKQCTRILERYGGPSKLEVQQERIHKVTTGTEIDTKQLLGSQ